MDEVITHRDPPKLGDLIGREIGGYRLERLLGEGGMGSVYLATHARLGKRLAIKVIARKYTMNPDVVGRFFREAKAVAALDDANIVELYDLHEFDDGLTYISMQFVEGDPLSKLLEHTRMMQVDATVAIGLQIASGLDAAHERGIVHRDIKPDNVLISRRWRRRYFVTILDFGIAKLLDAHMASNYETRTSVVMGTLAYMAPEQARAERNIDARADVYSLGVVLYEMLTSRRPYNEDTVYGLVQKHVERATFPRPSEVRTDIPATLEELLLDMLQIDRHKRPASMKEVGQRLAKSVPNGDVMLRTLATRLGLEQAGPPQQAHDITLVGDVESALTRWTPQPPPRRPRGWLTGFVGLALGIGGTLMVHASMQGPKPEQVAKAAEPAKPPVAKAAPPPAKAAPPPDVQPPASPPKIVPPAAPPTAAPLVDPPATKPAPPADPRASKPAPSVALPTPAPAKPNAPPSAPAPIPVPPPSNPVVHADGVLVIRVHSWADVTVDRKSVGTAPLRVKLPAGRHEVNLTNADHNETITVTIGAKPETIIEKSW